MSAKRRPIPKIAAANNRDAAFQDAVVLVREPFVIDKSVAMQAIRYTKELLPGSFELGDPSGAASSSRRRHAGNR
ncbi:MAG TPA: hypothetical protein PK156_07380 [Polyangium sp.]|nr:hypothetical protein [Polyangium sp.]